MSQENVEIVRRAFGGAGARGLEETARPGLDEGQELIGLGG